MYTLIGCVVFATANAMLLVHDLRTRNWLNVFFDVGFLIFWVFSVMGMIEQVQNDLAMAASCCSCP